MSAVWATPGPFAGSNSWAGRLLFPRFPDKPMDWDFSRFSLRVAGNCKTPEPRVRMGVRAIPAKQIFRNTALTKMMFTKAALAEQF
jgi:hypothetical protein